MASIAAMPCLFALAGSRIMKSIVASPSAFIRATTNASGASRIAPFSRLRSRSFAMPAIVRLAVWALQGDIVRYAEMRERPTLLGAGRRPAQPMGPDVEHLFADVAVDGEPVQGGGAHLRLEPYIELGQQIGLRLEVGE